MNSMRFAQFAAVALCAAVAAFPAACTTTSEGDRPAREQNRVTGTVTTLASTSLDRAYSASQDALASLQFPVQRQTKDALTAQLVAKTADDKTVTVYLNRKSDTITEVNVSAGPVNQALADTVAQRIQDRIR
jgi:hypothetical protein